MRRGLLIVIGAVAMVAGGCTVYHVPPQQQAYRAPQPGYAPAPYARQQHRQPHAPGYGHAPGYAPPASEYADGRDDRYGRAPGYAPAAPADQLANPYLAEPAAPHRCDCQCDREGPPPGGHGDAYRSPNPDDPSAWLE